MNTLFKIIKNLFTDKLIRFNYIQYLGLFSMVSDYRFLAMKYEIAMQTKLSFENPITFNEKLQWLKLYDRKLKYTVMVDKYKVREYITRVIGEQYLIPLIGVWNSPKDIDFKKLPNQFVIKCNHNSGLGMYICQDKAKMDVSKVKKNLKKGLKQDYYLTGREWPYKGVERKIIAEQYLADESGQLIDYKVHCFNGEPKFILVCKDRFKASGLTEDFFTTNWQHMSVKRPKISNSEEPIKRPVELEEMLEVSKKLSKDIPFLRVDFYIVNHQVYFSELTFFPASGFQRFEPDEWDYIFGEYLKLPDKWEEEK